MNYMVIPCFVVLITFFQRFQTHGFRRKKIRENICVIWCITLLFSLLGAIGSFHLYHYEVFKPFSLRLVSICILYLALTAVFIAIAPSGYGKLCKKKSSSPEELLYAEYHFNHSLEMLRKCFLSLLLIVPVLYYAYCCHESRLAKPLDLKESYLIGGLFFVSFCVLLPISVRQSIFWLGQLQKIPEAYEENLINREYQHTRYVTRNRRI